MRSTRCACGGWQSIGTNGFGAEVEGCERGTACPHERARLAADARSAAAARAAAAVALAAVIERERAATAPPAPARSLHPPEIMATMASKRETTHARRAAPSRRAVKTPAKVPAKVPAKPPAKAPAKAPAPAEAPRARRTRGRTYAYDATGDVITGLRLRRLREDKKIHVREVANAAGVSPAFVQQCEARGDEGAMPKAVEIWRVLHELLGNADWPARSGFRRSAAAPEIALVAQSPASAPRAPGARTLPPVQITTAHVDALVALLEPTTALALEALERLRAAARAAESGEAAA